MMDKKNKQQKRAAKAGKRTVERRNKRNQYSGKPPNKTRQPWQPFAGMLDQMKIGTAAAILLREMTTPSNRLPWPVMPKYWRAL